MTDSTHDVFGPLASVLLPIRPESVQLAREWLGLIFDTWCLPETENAQLCVSELTSNVYRHARNSGAVMQIEIRLYLERVRVDVYDQSKNMPKLTAILPDLDDSIGLPIEDIPESGNGLFLVDALANDWGCRRLSSIDAKAVWFAINLRP